MDQTPTIHPATIDRWPDLEALFGAKGACGGCWCMYWILKRSVFELQKGEANKMSLWTRVASDTPPGLLAYIDNHPVGWCAVAPRESYPVLERSKILARVDDQPVWSVPCLFVHKRHRRQGVSTALLRAAVEHARHNGASIVEGYPIDANKPIVPDVFAWTGIAATFRKVGFIEVARRSPTRPIMRMSIRSNAEKS